MRIEKPPGPVAGALARVFRAARKVRGAGPVVPILSFHRVSTLRSDHWMTLRPEAFEAILRAVGRRYRFVSLAEADEILASGRDPGRVTAVAFDDCYGCNYVHAVPVLRSLRVPATFFVSSGFVGSPEPFPHDVAKGYRDLPNFTADQLREMAADPLFEIGSHTVSHVDFSAGPPLEVVGREMVESKAALEAITGRPVTRLAIPFGSEAHCSAAAIAGARAAGYGRVYSFFGGLNRVLPDGHVAYVLNRICPEYDSIPYVLACLEGYRGRASFRPWVEAPPLVDGFHPSERQAAEKR